MDDRLLEDQWRVFSVPFAKIFMMTGYPKLQALSP
jgi:hypothetical protein